MIARARGRSGAGTAMLAVVCVIGLAWLAGFAWFVRGAARADQMPPACDGIVVLTGGADRVETGLHLLQAGRGRLLLISGVGPGAQIGALLREAGIEPDRLDSRIALGRTATTTIGNADETAAWARAHGIASLIVVTASYHMQRALTEIGRTLPEVRLWPMAVVPPALRGTGRLSTLRLLAHEYTKWLVSELGLTRLQPQPQPREAG